MTDGYWQDVLRSMHGIYHVSLTLAPVSPLFNISVEYLQTLMMIVAIMLGAGFAVLVLLALYLCVVISYVQPFVWPPWWFRLLVILTSLSLIALTDQSLDGSLSIGQGVDTATAAISNLSALMAEAAQHEPDVALAASAFNASIMSTAACLGCLSSNGSSPLVPTNSTLGDVCSDLTLAPQLLRDAAELGRATAAGPPQADRILRILQQSSGWQMWACMLPLYALALTGIAVVAGALAGRRNLLLLAQFVGVIVWWMMCAVISVEVAMSVGFADACGGAVNTTLRVLWTEALHGHAAPSDGDLWHYNLSAHYLAADGCGVPNPLTSALRSHADAAHGAYEMLVAGPLPAKLPWVAKCADPSDGSEAASYAALGLAIEALLAPLGGASACGGAGVVRELFARGAEEGLCVQVGEGFVQLWYWQLLGGAVLVLVSLALPVLWHSHHLPAATLPTRRTLQRLMQPAHCARAARDCLLSCPPWPSRERWASGRPWRWWDRYARWREGGAGGRGADGSSEPPSEAPLRAAILFPRGHAPAADLQPAPAGVPLSCPSPTLTPLAGAGAAAAADQGAEPLLLSGRERMGTTCSSHEVL